MATQNSSSDMSFYIIMLALIAGMAFYISTDMEKRYGSAETAQADSQPVVISVTETDTVAIKPIAEIAATETTPEAVVVKKIEQKTVVTTAVVPVKKEQPLEAKPVVAKLEVAKSEIAKPAAPASLVDTMIKTVEQAAAPVIQAVTETVQSEPEVTEPSGEAYKAYQQGYRDGFTKGYQKASRQQYNNNGYGSPYPYQ